MNQLEEKNVNRRLGIEFEALYGVTQYIYGDTIDELIDGLAVLKNASFINKFVRLFQCLTKEQLARLDTLILECTNEEEILNYVTIRKGELSNPEEFENKVSTFENAFIIARYAEETQVKEIGKLVDEIIKRKDGRALNVISRQPGVDLLKIKKAIFQTRYVMGIIEFCHNYQDEADIITQEDIEEVEQMAISCKETARYMVMCAKKLKGANIERLQKEVEESGESGPIFEFASVEGADINKLWKAIKKTGKRGTIDVFMNQYGDGIKGIKKFSKIFN